MFLNILAVIAGFILWSVLWVGGNALLTTISPEWYGEGMKSDNSSLLLFSLFRSVVFSLIAGYVAALIAPQNGFNVDIALGIFLLAVGIFVQAQVWKEIPIWYHLSFLVLLIPITIIGGCLRTGV